MRLEYEKLCRELKVPDPLARISTLEKIGQDSSESTVRRVLEALADDSIRVRGEAFAWLVGINADISKTVSEGLFHEDRHVRGYCALVLANRGDVDSSVQIAGLVKDESAMVRSCAAGALGYMKSIQYGGALLALHDDESEEVRECAKDAAGRMGLNW